MGLLAGILAIRTIPIADRLALVRAGRVALGKAPPDDENVTQWLARTGVKPRARSLLFEPLCRAVMNDEPERCSAAIFSHTLRIAFSSGPGGASLWVPTVPWGAVLDEPAQTYFGKHDVRVRLNTKVRALDLNEQTPRIQLDADEVLEDHERVVLALPWTGAAKLDTANRFVGRAPELRAAPIVNLHVPLPANTLPCDDPVIAFEYGQPFHFICRRPNADSSLQSETPACMIAGGAYPLDGLPQREIVALGLEQLARFTRRTSPWPQETVEGARVVREAHATIAATPGVSALRPAPGPTQVPGLWLAGDWTDVGLPSTLEGAAHSGFAPLDANTPGSTLSPSG